MSIFQELKRRNVFRVTAAYVVIAWLLLQVGDVVFEALEVDASANRLLMALVLLGLIPTILFAWAFEMTPEGIKRDKDVVRDEANEQRTAKKLDYLTLGVLVVVGVMSLWQHWSDEPEPAATDASTQEMVDAEFIPVTANIDDKSLAVLPFTNVANTSDNEPFTVGIHDDLITSLSKISALKVISRTSVLNYQSTDMPIRAIASQLGVAHIVEGGVQRVGDQVRLNVKLVDAQSEEPLWAETYNRELTASNIFRIQTEVSQEIANALKAQLTDAEVQSLGKQQTDNLDAYNAYLAGRQRLLNRNTQSLYQALSLFQKATELDPDYALAYVGQADTWSLLNEYSDVSEANMMEQGLPLIEKALALDPQLAEAHTSRANYLAEKDDLEGAKNAFEMALELNPNYPTAYHWYGNLLDRMGQTDQALAMYRKAVELDPISPVVQTNIGAILSGKGRHDEALEQFERIVELSPDYPGAAGGKAMVYSNQGKLDEAIKWQRIAIKQDPGNVSRKAELASLYMDLGLTDQAQTTIEEIKLQSPGYEKLIYVEASLDMYQGNYQQAADRFDRAFQLNPNEYSYLGNLTFYQMLLGEHEQAIANYLRLYPGTEVGQFAVTAENFDSTINMIHLWQVTGEAEKAARLINELEQLLAEFPELNNDFRQAMVAAVKGEYDQSAQLFYAEYKKGGSRGYWRGEHLPMLTEVLNTDFSQEFLSIYEFELNQQRQRVLASL
ncbi:tetratricopeptide repeat protein [Marinicella meishanensis]|uniref:tetratricopeptide repeat protein n=1 Tax=Marinicella meishanensis TaxID=2873263 RepID=UPI001CBDD87D|nr:tetratricopeptide repeat protein [Marinicella sp. NBU2979]